MIIDTTGLSYYDRRDESLASRVAMRMRELELRGCAQYLEFLESSGSTELDRLVSHLTIGETYFFRNKSHFEALEETILLELISRNFASRKLDIWSAGCATGPEPYSLNILLRHRMAMRFQGWQLSILATDINQDFLKSARKASFGQWAFRAIPEDVLRHCFQRVDNRWKLAERYKTGVNFLQHNLVKDRFPPTSASSPALFDLIVCRNVLIYFNLKIIRELVDKFYDCLKPGGFLLVGHSEPNIVIFQKFETVRACNAIFYQKNCEQPSPSVSIDQAGPEPWEPPAKPSPRPLDSTERIWQLTDEGRWEEGLYLCEVALENNPLDSQLHFLLSLIYHNLHREEERDNSLKRALYLDRGFVQAHYYRGVFECESGRTQEARRSFRSVLRLLDSEKPGSRSGVSGMLEFDQLRRMAHYYLSRLEDQPGG